MKTGSQALFHAASQPKKLWIVKGAAHLDLHVFEKQSYEQRVLQFLRVNLR
jgi:fermentation-respiration switch protein FrsA (DUF1100 family)